MFGESHADNLGAPSAVELIQQEKLLFADLKVAARPRILHDVFPIFAERTNHQLGPARRERR